MDSVSLWEKLQDPRRMRRFLSRQWRRLGSMWYEDSAVLGALVEVMGNRVRVEGLQFSVESPLILRKLKSRFLTDRYEKPERRLLRKYLDPALPVVELGACIGVVSCVTNRLLLDPSAHVVVEAHPQLIPLLEQNRELNGCKFTIVAKALAYGTQEVAFGLHEYFVGSGLRRPAERQVMVPATTLRALADERGFGDFQLICDIEGYEVDLIANEGDLLRERVSLLVLETHGFIVGDDEIARMAARLRELGFQLRE